MLLNRLLGTAISLENKTIAVTGASGTLGRALLTVLQQQGAQPIALTTSPEATFPEGIRVLSWQLGAEAELKAALQTVDILVINHGINVQGDRTPDAIAASLQVNALSVLRLMDTFITAGTTAAPPSIQQREIWVNTSEAEVSPAFSPLYEISKRLIGDLIALKRPDSPYIIRKLILGPFKSNLNPIGILSADWVARQIIALIKRDMRLVIVTVNPLTYLLLPLKEATQSLYFRLFSAAIPRPNQSAADQP